MNPMVSDGSRRIRTYSNEDGRAMAGRPAGTWPTVCMPVYSCPSHEMAAVAPTITAIGANFGRMSAIRRLQNSVNDGIPQRENARNSNEISPIVALGQWIAVNAKSPVIPSRGLDWFNAMTSAAPLVNPLMTGRLKKLDRNPIRAIPQTKRIVPVTNANCCAINE